MRATAPALHSPGARGRGMVQEAWSELEDLTVGVAGRGEAGLKPCSKFWDNTGTITFHGTRRAYLWFSEYGLYAEECCDTS